MGRLIRRISWRLAAVASVVVLAAVAVAGYRTHIPTGLWIAPQHVALGRDLASDVTTNDACLALPAAIRRHSPALAFISQGSLRTLSLHSCRQRTLLGAGAHAPVRVSADGRWIASGAAVVTPISGGQVQRPLGTHVFLDANASSWTWSPRGDRMAGVTTDGAVLSGAPGRRPETLEPAGFGASQVLFDGGSAVIVVRDARSLWRISLPAGPAHLVYRDPSPQATLTLAGVVNGSAVVWRQPFVSASAAADGDPLWRIDLADGRRYPLFGKVLVEPGYVRRCGEGLIVAAGGDRVATDGKALVTVSPRWRIRRVGRGVDPSCSATGRTIAYAQGDSERGYAFGNERRRIVVVQPGKRARDVNAPPTRGPGADEPILSRDGRIVLWAQTEAENLRGPTGPRAGAALLAAQLGPTLRRTGPIADLGQATDYYGTWSWPLSLAPEP